MTPVRNPAHIADVNFVIHEVDTPSGTMFDTEGETPEGGVYFSRKSSSKCHLESIEWLESNDLIPCWQRDEVNFPLLKHPFLSGKDKFDAMLEIERVATKLEWFFYPLTLKDIP